MRQNNSKSTKNLHFKISFQTEIFCIILWGICLLRNIVNSARLVLVWFWVWSRIESFCLVWKIIMRKLCRICRRWHNQKFKTQFFEICFCKLCRFGLKHSLSLPSQLYETFSTVALHYVWRVTDNNCHFKSLFCVEIGPFWILRFLYRCFELIWLRSFV